MDQGDILEDAIKQVVQSVNQMLLKTSTGTLTQIKPPHDNVTKVQ